MRLFKVICLCVGGKYKSFLVDQIMTEVDFLNDQCDAYVASKHVVEVTKEEASALGYVDPNVGIEHTVTAQDIENNPDGELQLGETITIPATEETDKKPKKKK